VSELGGGLIAFPLVAVMAREDKIAHAVRTAATARENVIDLEGLVGRTTIDTLPVIFFEQVCSGFPSNEFAALVLYAGHLGILHELSIELDPFYLDAAKWHPSLVAYSPGQHIPDAGK
jgi:hypothetical protein